MAILVCWRTQLYSLVARIKKWYEFTASKSTGEALYVSSCSDNDLPHTILHNTLIALREDKLEFGHGASDPYMQIARCYDLLVEVLTTRSAKGQQLSRTWSSMSLDLFYRYMVLFTHPCICWLDFAQGRCWSYVVGSMMVTNQLLNHLASLFSCLLIAPKLVKPK